MTKCLLVFVNEVCKLSGMNILLHDMNKDMRYGFAEELLTPFAGVHLEVLQKNLARYADYFRSKNINIRPHIKTHKSADIAKMQLDIGAAGITVATVQEAHDMYTAGINDIFIARPVVDKTSLKLLSELRIESFIFAVDSITHLEILSQALETSKKKVRVRIEIDSGQKRCGCIVDLSRLKLLCNQLSGYDCLILDGVFTHAGHSYKCSQQSELKKIAAQESTAVVEAAAILKDLGVSCHWISVGSTPTAMHVSEPLVNEIRPGNYCFNDVVQVVNKTALLEECAYRVYTRVLGVYDDRIVIDAGSKALGLDQGAHGVSLLKGYGLLTDYNLFIDSLSEEHGIIKNDFPENFQVGEVIEVIPNHSCASANMFSGYHVVRDGQIIDYFKTIGKK